MNDKLLHDEAMTLSRPEGFERIFLWFFAGAFVLFLAFYATRPITDPDFWWHLKSGEVMVESGDLLASDPFTFSGDGVVSAREALILKGYWLWQVMAYGLSALLGFNGIFLLNLLTVLAMAGVVAWQMRRQCVGHVLTVVLMMLGFYLVKAAYPLERPQVVSFLLAALLVALLDRVRAGGKPGWALPLLMTLWANLHGGFVVGAFILLCFAAGVVIEYRHDLPRMRHLLGWVALALGASLLNPNGPLAFSELFSFYNSAVMTGISEYQSTWVKFQNGAWFVAILWLLIALYGFGSWSARRLYWPELIVVLFLAYISVMHVRNIGFFAVALLPAVGSALQAGTSRRQWQLPPFLSLLLLTLCSTVALWSSYTLWQAREGGWPVKAIYPEDAITFLQTSNLSGRMFNDYTYGGYLLWRLSPQFKVFIDGRGLDTRVFDDYQKLVGSSADWIAGHREYEALLERYAIDYIIQPIYDGDGQIQPLMKSLLHQPEWVPIYLDATVYILARLSPTNAETISTYRIDKDEFKTRLLLIVNYLSQSAPQEIGYQVARAGVLIYLSMYDEANAQVAAIAAAAPQDRSLPALRRELAVLRVKRLRQ